MQAKFRKRLATKIPAEWQEIFEIKSSQEIQSALTQLKAKGGAADAEVADVLRKSEESVGIVKADAASAGHMDSPATKVDTVKWLSKETVMAATRFFEVGGEGALVP